MIVFRYIVITLWIWGLFPQAVNWWADFHPVLQTRLEIPEIAVDVPLTRFWLDGVSWAIDPWETRVGHLQGTSWLDEGGNMVIGGHVEYPDGTPAVFEKLADLEVGDRLTLRLGTRTWDYRIVEIKVVAYDDLTVLYPTPQPRLTLITCDEPSYDSATGLYDKRLVIMADAE